MLPWKRIATAVAPDGTTLELRRRGHDITIRAGAHELMSNHDEPSSRALAALGCAELGRVTDARVLIGGLGMGYTLRAALDRVGSDAVVEVAELVEAVAEWNQGEAGLGALAGHPLNDPRAVLRIEDVRQRIRVSRQRYDAILLDVDNGPIALAHATNNSLYGRRGLGQAWQALKPGGVFAVWSLSGDPRFTRRLEQAGFEARAHRVEGSRQGRGREHVVWLARRPVRAGALRPAGSRGR
jgi:spermidine synthase